MRDNTSLIQAAASLSDKVKGTCKTIKWAKRGDCHVGRSGEQQFVAMPDGAGCWLLTEVGPDGRGELIAHGLLDETAAMITALDYVRPGVAAHWLIAAVLGVLMVALLVAVNVRPPV